MRLPNAGGKFAGSERAASLAFRSNSRPCAPNGVAATSTLSRINAAVGTSISSGARAAGSEVGGLLRFKESLCISDCSWSAKSFTCNTPEPETPFENVTQGEDEDERCEHSVHPRPQSAPTSGFSKSHAKRCVQLGLCLIHKHLRQALTQSLGCDCRRLDKNHALPDLQKHVLQTWYRGQPCRLMHRRA